MVKAAVSNQQRRGGIRPTQKYPSKLKTGLEGNCLFGRGKTVHQSSVFLFGGLTLFIEKKEPMICELPRKFIGSASVRPAL